MNVPKVWVFVILLSNAYADYLECYVCDDCEENEGHYEYCSPLEEFQISTQPVPGMTQAFEVEATTLATNIYQETSFEDTTTAFTYAASTEQSNITDAFEEAVSTDFASTIPSYESLEELTTVDEALENTTNTEENTFSSQTSAFTKDPIDDSTQFSTAAAEYTTFDVLNDTEATTYIETTTATWQQSTGTNNENETNFEMPTSETLTTTVGVGTTLDVEEVSQTIAMIFGVNASILAEDETTAEVPKTSTEVPTNEHTLQSGESIAPNRENSTLLTELQLQSMSSMEDLNATVSSFEEVIGNASEEFTSFTEEDGVNESVGNATSTNAESLTDTNQTVNLTIIPETNGTMMTTNTGEITYNSSTALNAADFNFNSTADFELNATTNGNLSNVKDADRFNDISAITLVDRNTTRTDESGEEDFGSETEPVEAINSTNSTNVHLNVTNLMALTGATSVAMEDATLDASNEMQLVDTDGVSVNSTSLESPNITVGTGNASGNTTTMQGQNIIEEINATEHTRRATASPLVVMNFTDSENERINVTDLLGLAGSADEAVENKSLAHGLSTAIAALEVLETLEAVRGNITNRTTLASWDRFWEANSRGVDEAPNITQIRVIRANKSDVFLESKEEQLFQNTFRSFKIPRTEVYTDKEALQARRSTSITNALGNEVQQLETRSFRQALRGDELRQYSIQIFPHKYNKLSRTGRMELGNVTYKCYTVRVKGKNKMQINKGCVAVPAAKTACALLADKYGEEALQHCQVCLNGKCNRSDGNLLGYSKLCFVLTMCIGWLL